MPVLRISDEAHEKLKIMAKKQGKEMSKTINDIILLDNPVSEKQFLAFLASWQSFLESSAGKANYQKAIELLQCYTK